MDRLLRSALLAATCLVVGCTHTPRVTDIGVAALQVTAATESRSAAIEALLQEAQSAEQQGERSIAGDKYRRILVLDPAHLESHHHLAVAADQAGRFTESAAHYRQALAHDPHNADIRTSLAWSYVLQGRESDAERELRRVLQQEPKHSVALYNLGWIHAQRGEEQEALALFRLAGTEIEAQRALLDARRQSPGVIAKKQRSPEQPDSLSAPSPRRARAAASIAGNASAVVAARLPTSKPHGMQEAAAPAGKTLPESPADWETIDTRETPADRESKADINASRGDRELTRLASHESDVNRAEHNELASAPSEAMDGEDSSEPAIDDGGTISAEILADNAHNPSVAVPPTPPGDLSRRATGGERLSAAMIGTVVRAAVEMRSAAKGAETGSGELEAERRPENSPERMQPPARDQTGIDEEALLVEAARMGLNAGLPAAYQVGLPLNRDTPRRFKLTRR